MSAGRQAVVVDAARLDRDHAPPAVDGARIAEVEVNKAMGGKAHIGLKGLAFEFGQHGDVVAPD